MENVCTPISGVRLFLFALLELIKQGKQEDIHAIQMHLPGGIASYLSQKYSSYFCVLDMNQNSINALDSYYMQWNGCFDDYFKKYNCTENDGLFLLVKLALNHIP